jgi:hypothetical protein
LVGLGFDEGVSGGRFLGERLRFDGSERDGRFLVERLGFDGGGLFTPPALPDRAQTVLADAGLEPSLGYETCHRMKLLWNCARSGNAPA